MRKTTKAAIAGGALGLGFVLIRAYQKKTPATETMKKAATVTASTAAAGAIVGAAMEAAPHVKRAKDGIKSRSAVVRWAEVAAAAAPLIQTFGDFFEAQPEPAAKKTEGAKSNAQKGKQKVQDKYVFLNGSLGKVRLATTFLEKTRGRKNVFSMFGPLRSRAARFGRR